MLPARKALRQIYANTVNRESIKATLDEMRARGFPEELYQRDLNEAIDKGLIPVAGRSVVGGKVLSQSDILTIEDVLQDVPEGFSQDYGFYGVG